MLLVFVALVVCVSCVAHYFRKTSEQSRHQTPTRKLSLMKSISLLLDLLFTKQPTYEMSNEMSKVYGKLAICARPFQNIVFANITDLELSKRIMSSSAWSDRLRSNFYIHTWSFGKPLGLFFGGGGYWKEARKLTVKLFQKLDVYKQENSENFINFEVSDLEREILDAVKQGGGRATLTMYEKCAPYTLNVVIQVILGKRFAPDDPTATKLTTLVQAWSRQINFGASILEIFPWLLRLPFLRLMKDFDSLNAFVYEFLKREVLEPKRKTKSYLENPLDFVDHFLLEADRRADEIPRYLTDENLLTTLRDLMMAGGDVSNITLQYAILHVSQNQQIQGKIHDEIDQIIGARKPRYNDRLSMPYTRAVILEALRLSTPVPATARCPLSDNQINGDHIPKGSFMIMNLYAIHRDPDLWENPEEFQPQRFLNENNELVNLNKILPFGWGTRYCVGEKVAQITLFLFFVTLMQTFLFQLSKNHPPPSMKNQIGLSKSLLPYYVTVECRKV